MTANHRAINGRLHNGVEYRLGRGMTTKLKNTNSINNYEGICC